MKPALVLGRVELALLLREPAAVFFTLALPLLLLALNGAQGNAPVAELGGLGAVDVFVPGYLVYVMATTALMNLPEGLADERARGFLRRLRVSPLRPWQVLGAHAVTHLAMIVAGVVALLTLAATAYGMSAPAAWGPVLLALVLSVTASLALGFLLAAVAPTVRTAQAVASAVYFPAIFLSGAVFPRVGLPEVAQRIGDWIPLTYAVRSIIAAWTGGTVDGPAVAVLAAVTAVAAGAAVRAFRWEARP